MTEPILVVALDARLRDRLARVCGGFGRRVDAVATIEAVKARIEKDQYGWIFLEAGRFENLPSFDSIPVAEFDPSDAKPMTALEEKVREVLTGTSDTSSSE